LLKRFTAAFEAFEKIGAAKSMRRLPARERSASCFASAGVGGLDGLPAMYSSCQYRNVAS